MRAEWISDNKDRWKNKGFSFLLRAGGQSAQLCVVPMFTEPWYDRSKQRYCKELGVSVNDILIHDSYSLTNKGYDGGYWTKVRKLLPTTKGGHVFLDPETGITNRKPPDARYGRSTTKRVRPPRQTYVYVGDVVRVTQTRHDALCLVFDHTASRTSTMQAHYSSLCQEFRSCSEDSVEAFAWASVSCPGGLVVVSPSANCLACARTLAENAGEGMVVGG